MTMTINDLEKEIASIWSYLQSGYDNNPEEMKIRLQELSSYFSWVNYNIPKMKRRYSNTLKKGLIELAKDSANLGLSKSLQTSLIDSVSGEERQLWDELVQMDRAISKQMAAITSLLSYSKEELSISRQATH